MCHLIKSFENHSLKVNKRIFLLINNDINMIYEKRNDNDWIRETLFDAICDIMPLIYNHINLINS